MRASPALSSTNQPSAFSPVVAASANGKEDHPEAAEEKAEAGSGKENGAGKEEEEEGEEREEKSVKADGEKEGKQEEKEDEDGEEKGN